MPRNMQIAVIRRIVEQLNPHLSDPDLIPRPDGGYESWEDCVDDASFEENRSYLEERYPNIRWRAPEIEPSIEREQREWTMVVNREDEVIVYSKEITIRPHKVKAKARLTPTEGFN